VAAIFIGVDLAKLLRVIIAAAALQRRKQGSADGAGEL